MKITIIKTTVLATIATLTFAPVASAHHPSADVNPNYATVDENISDMHNEIIDAMLEDSDLMSSARRGAGSDESPVMADGMGANASGSATRSATQVTTAPGMGTRSASRGSSR